MFETGVTSFLLTVDTHFDILRNNMQYLSLENNKGLRLCYDRWQLTRILYQNTAVFREMAVIANISKR